MNSSARRPCFIDHFFLTSDFRQVPRRNFLQFFPFLAHRCFRFRNFHSLRYKKKFVFSSFLAIWSWWWCGIEFPIRILANSSASRTHVRFVRSITPTNFHNSTGRNRSDWCLKLLTHVFDGIFWAPRSRRGIQPHHVCVPQICSPVSGWCVGLEPTVLDSMG